MEKNQPDLGSETAAGQADAITAPEVAPDETMHDETVQDGSVQVVPLQIKKNVFVEMVATRCGQRKNDVKPIVEATLAALGAALADGHELQIPPFGKVKVIKVRENERAHVLSLRLAVQK
ncbi:MAG: HU family DNA-binding protein [Rhodobacteraceae bacterium]|nr:HU family DNA-binding protein [Paracoccaceae bacterium]